MFPNPDSQSSEWLKDYNALLVYQFVCGSVQMHNPPMITVRSILNDNKIVTQMEVGSDKNSNLLPFLRVFEYARRFSDRSNDCKYVLGIQLDRILSMAVIVALFLPRLSVTGLVAGFIGMIEGLFGASVKVIKSIVATYPWSKNFLTKFDCMSSWNGYVVTSLQCWLLIAIPPDAQCHICEFKVFINRYLSPTPPVLLPRGLDI